jgi:periplasmic protein CpxP/Spy
MKPGRMAAASAALVIVLFAGLALAQGMHGPHSHGDFFGGPMMGMFGDMLDLSDAQRAQIKQIYENAKPTLHPLREQEKKSHEALHQLITSGNFDQVKAQAIVNEETQVHAQLEMQHVLLASQAYQVLTAEQKTKLNEIMAKHQQRTEQHMQEHSESKQ